MRSYPRKTVLIASSSHTPYTIHVCTHPVNIPSSPPRILIDIPPPIHTLRLRRRPTRKPCLLRPPLPPSSILALRGTDFLIGLTPVPPMRPPTPIITRPASSIRRWTPRLIGAMTLRSCTRMLHSDRRGRPMVIVAVARGTLLEARTARALVASIRAVEIIGIWTIGTVRAAWWAAE